MSEAVDKGAQIPFASWGGSSKYAKRLVELFPTHKTYVEPFCGAASVFFAKEASEVEVLADTDADILFAFKFIRDASDADLARLQNKFNWKISKANYNRVTALKPSDAESRFYKFIFLRYASFNNHPVKGYAPSKEGNEFDVVQLAKFRERLAKVKLNVSDWKKTIDEYDSRSTFFFIDPPYEYEWGMGREAMGDEITADEISEKLKTVKGCWIVAYTDSAKARKALGVVGKIFTMQTQEARQRTGAAMRSRLFASNCVSRGATNKSFAVESEIMHFASNWSPEILKTVPTRDGIQIWDPEKKDPDVDRTELRPLAFFQPMKPAPRPTNDFRNIDDVFQHFATPGALATGIACEPKYNGFRVVVEKKSDRILIYTEDRWRDISASLPSVVKELKTIDGDFVLDTEFLALDEKGNVLPRRELARFRGKEPVDDSGVRLQVFHALWLPGQGNLTDAHFDDMRAELSKWFKGKKLTHLVESPYKIARNEKQLRDLMINWASKQPGSEGAMLKYITSTYSLGGEQDAWAKYKESRYISAIVYDRHPVKGSPGVYNFFCAVGPVEKPEEWQEVVEVNGKNYTVIGKTGNAKLAANKGDRIVAEVFELFYEAEPEKKKRIHWFGPPMVVSKTEQRPMTTDEVIEHAYAWEISKSLDDARSYNVRFLAESVQKADNEQRYVLGVVLEPEVVDAQGDIYSADEIRKACHDYLVKWRNRGYQHKIPINDQVDLVENLYVHPEMELKVGGTKIKTGTWLAGFHLHGDEYWTKAKKGEVTGLSIGGTAEKEPAR